jgi:hypothetical protein
MRKTLPALATACALVGVTAMARAQTLPAEPEPVRPTSSGTSAIVAGAVLFGAAYAPSYVAWLTDSIQQVQCLSTQTGWGIFSCNHVTDRMLVIPLAGPWMTLSSGQVAGGTWTGEQKALLVADGIAQDVGLAVLAYGVVQRLVLSPRMLRPEPPAAVTVRPGAGTAVAGLTVVADF